MTYQIESCPFCGDPHVEYVHDHCGVLVAMPTHLSPAAAVQLYNRRAPVEEVPL